MTLSTLSKNGQTTIPIEVRKMLGLQPTQKIVYRVVDGQVILEAAQSTTSSLYGCLSQSTPPSDSMEEARARYVQRKYGTTGGKK